MENRVAPKLRLLYDKEGDILHISAVPAYADQDSDFIGDDVYARMNPDTGAVESIEILGFSQHFNKLGDTFELPVVAELSLANDNVFDHVE